MCGFVGFTNHIDNSNRVLQEMLDKIKHRGPDAEGTYICLLYTSDAADE